MLGFKLRSSSLALLLFSATAFVAASPSAVDADVEHGLDPAARVFHTGRLVGSPCNRSNQCFSRNCALIEGSTTVKQCQRQPIGGPCFVDRNCLTRNCNLNTGVCVVPSKLKGICSSTVKCTRGLVCKEGFCAKAPKITTSTASTTTTTATTTTDTTTTTTASTPTAAAPRVTGFFSAITANMDATFYGLVAPPSPDAETPSFTRDYDAKMLVSLSPDVYANGGSQISLPIEDGGANQAYPFFGAVDFVGDGNLNFGSLTFAEVLRTAQTEPDAVVQGSTAGSDGYYQSALWDFDAESGEMTAYWTNSDGTRGGLYILARPDSWVVYLTPDQDHFMNTYGDYDAIRLFFTKTS